MPFALCGCEPLGENRPAAPRDTLGDAAGPGAPGEARAKRKPTNLRALIGRENWDVYYLAGNRIGYGYTNWRAVQGDKDLVAVDGRMRLSVKRFGQDSVSEIKMTVVETTTGEVRSFTSEAHLGSTPYIARGEIADGLVKMTLESGGRTEHDTHVWPAELRGYFELEEELLSAPMVPGEERTIRALVPPFNQPAVYELRALRVEPTELLDGQRDLLCIESTMTLPNVKEPTAGLLWTDPRGELLKTVLTADQTTVYRSTKEVALGGENESKFDLGDRMLVHVKKPPTDLHRAPKITYRVELDDADPVQVFLSDISQRVTSIDAHTAEISVRAVRPNDPPTTAWEQDPKNDAEAAGAEEPPTDEERQPNGFVQSDDPRIVGMAREVASRVQDPWRIAVALERLVHAKVATKNYSQTFATAAEVAESLEGDCTEHAVLLAALLRARGLPSRVAIGLVYMPSAQAFGFHMWTEVYVNNRWIGLDGTLGQGGIGAGHLKLAVSSLKDATAFSSFMPVARVLGKIKIEVADMKKPSS